MFYYFYEKICLPEDDVTLEKIFLGKTTKKDRQKTTFY